MEHVEKGRKVMEVLSVALSMYVQLEVLRTMLILDQARFHPTVVHCFVKYPCPYFVQPTCSLLHIDLVNTAIGNDFHGVLRHFRLIAFLEGRYHFEVEWLEHRCYALGKNRIVTLRRAGRSTAFL